MERSRPRPRVPRATEGAGDGSTDFNRWQHARVLARVIARGRGVWTLAGASVERRVMSGATIAGGDETS